MSRRNRQPKLLDAEHVIKPTLSIYRKALDFRTYRLRFRGSRVNSKDKSRTDSRRKKMTAEMETHHFDSADPISVLDFLSHFRRACDNLRVHEGAAVFLFAHFIKGSAKQDLIHRIETDDIDDDLSTDSTYDTTDMLRCYDEVVNYLLATYADESTISQAHSAIQALRQRLDQSPIAFKDVVFARTIRCGRVYDQTARIHIFIQGLHENVRSQARRYFTEKKGTTLDNLARYVNEIDRKSDGSVYGVNDRKPKKNQDGTRKGRNSQQ